MTKQELVTKRANLWNAMNAFLDSHRNEKGVLSVEDDATYAGMEKEFDSLTNEIKRLDRKEAIDAELSKPVNTPIVTKPTNGDEDDKGGRGSKNYKKSFWNAMRSKTIRPEVHDALQVGTDSEGGYLVPDEFEKTLIESLEEENIFRKLATVIKTSSGDRKIPVVASKGTASWESRIFYDAFEDAGFKVGATLIWKKPRAPFMRTDWKFNMEPVIFGWKKKGKHIWYGDQKQLACFEFDMIKNSKVDGEGHPSSKPIPMIAYLLKQCTQINGLVLDGFLGSASTLIACEQLERICYGIEVEPKYIDVAVNRYKKTKEGNTSDIYLIRDGKKYTYEEVQVDDEEAEKVQTD